MSVLKWLCCDVVMLCLFFVIVDESKKNSQPGNGRLVWRRPLLGASVVAPKFSANPPKPSSNQSTSSSSCYRLLYSHLLMGLLVITTRQIFIKIIVNTCTKNIHMVLTSVQLVLSLGELLVVLQVSTTTSFFSVQQLVTPTCLR